LTLRSAVDSWLTLRPAVDSWLTLRVPVDLVGRHHLTAQIAARTRLPRLGASLA
jgi:hypothetical protein